MTNSIENNAYRLLGLDTTASQKDILKRYKEIINRLRIDDIPIYDLDLGLPSKMRNESAVEDAFKRLQSAKDNLKEYFFWFQILDKTDERALDCLKNKEFEKAIEIWKDASENKNSTSYFYKKNLALLYCFLILKKHDQAYLKYSISIWHEIINADKFWSAFTKVYGIQKEQTLSSDIISEFKKNAVQQISDIYADLCQHHKNKIYIKEFQEKFGAHGKKTEKDLLTPILESIYEEIKKFQKININENKKENTETEKVLCDNCGADSSSIFSWFSFWLCDDGTILCNKCRKKSRKSCKKIDDLCEHEKRWRKRMKEVYVIVSSLESKFNELIKMGLYEDPQTKVARDRAAEEIRNIAVTLYNNSFLHEDAIKLTKTAQKICGTDSFKNKLESDIKTIKKIVESDRKTSFTLDLNGRIFKFKNNFLEYENKKMSYHDIEEISYIATAHSINGIPTGTTYKFTLVSIDDEISLSPDEEEWSKLINISKQIIEPIIIQKIIKQIFEKNVNYAIGEVTFNKKGYSKKKFFGGTDQVLWSDTIFIPQFYEGQVILFKEKNEKGAQFAAIKMDEPNAVVLPELLQACVDAYRMQNQR